MRDPGPPRRNPFFEHASDGASDDPGMGWRDPDDTASSGSDAHDPADGVAQPEAAEHLVAAAHEVVLTVKVLVDATEAVLAEQRAAMELRNRQARHAPPADAPRPDGDVTDLATVRRAEGP